MGWGIKAGDGQRSSLTPLHFLVNLILKTRVTHMLKLGYKASAEQFGPRELLEFSVIAEDVGFDSVMVSDHFQPWRHNGGPAP